MYQEAQFATMPATNSFHILYTALHKAHYAAPEVFTDHECNRILTAVMAAKEFSWHVIGITENALIKFSELDYRYQSKQGLTRAHIKPRIQTVRRLLEQNEPMRPEQFMEFWFENDKTILCAQGENKNNIPPFCRIENHNGALFSCKGKLAGWHHRKTERDFLSSLHEKYLRGELSFGTY